MYVHNIHIQDNSWRKPEKIAAIVLNFQICGFTIEKYVQKSQVEWQTV